MRSHSRRFLVGLLAGSGLLVGTSVYADATPDVEPAEVEQLDAADLEQMGIDTSTATDEWRIEKFEDGTYRMVFGPGAPAISVDSRAVAVASGDGSVESVLESSGSATAAEDPGAVETQALAWYCDVNTYFSTVLESSTLGSELVLGDI